MQNSTIKSTVNKRTSEFGGRILGRKYDHKMIPELSGTNKKVLAEALVFSPN